MTDRSDLVDGRIRHIREVCLNCLNQDQPGDNRYWLASTVLNILNGAIDEQISLRKPMADRSEEYEKCGAVKMGWHTYHDSGAFRCTKPKGHDGQHGYAYAGVFWGRADD